MNVELLWWAGCPSTNVVHSQLAVIMSDIGYDGTEIHMREITSIEQAVAEHFLGSPTIRLNGVDPFATDHVPPSLSCRIYHLRDGRVSPTPDPDELREALMRARRE
jgi:hypothetical protein